MSSAYDGRPLGRGRGAHRDWKRRVAEFTKVMPRDYNGLEGTGGRKRPSFVVRLSWRPLVADPTGS